MATYRINGKVVNDITLEGYLDEKWDENYVQENELGLTSSPVIFHKKFPPSVISLGDLVHINDEGFMQLKVNIGALAEVISVTLGLILFDDKGKIVDTLLAGIGSDREKGGSISIEWYGYVKKGYRIVLSDFSIAAISDLTIHYRIHPCKYKDNNVYYEGISTNTKKVSGYVANEIGISKYNKDLDKFDRVTDKNNPKGLVTSVEGDFKKKITAYDLTTNRLQFDGYTEMNVNIHIGSGSALPEVFEVYVKDINDNIKENFTLAVQSFYLAEVLQLTGLLTFGYEGKKGDYLQIQGGPFPAVMVRIGFMNNPTFIKAEGSD